VSAVPLPAPLNAHARTRVRRCTTPCATDDQRRPAAEAPGIDAAIRTTRNPGLRARATPLRAAALVPAALRFIAGEAGQATRCTAADRFDQGAELSRSGASAWRSTHASGRSSADALRMHWRCALLHHTGMRHAFMRRAQGDPMSPTPRLCLIVMTCASEGAAMRRPILVGAHAATWIGHMPMSLKAGLDVVENARTQDACTQDAHRAETDRWLTIARAVADGRTRDAIYASPATPRHKVRRWDWVLTEGAA